MKNKVNLKKYLLQTLLLAIGLIILFLIINIYEYHVYTKNFNLKLEKIITVLETKYENLSKNEIIEILTDSTLKSTNFFKEYGIDEKTSAILENEKSYHYFLILNTLFLALSILLLVIIFLKYNHTKEKDIKDIIKYIEEINRKNYELKIDSNSEDELSILKNEIYKTTVMLKEIALNSNLDKVNLKKSLEDISHQLKTPLTSILIMLDDLIDDQEMDYETRNSFLRDIKREIFNINFLVQAILKLSKFEANTITFQKNNIYLKDILAEVLKNVSALCDLKNIKIEIKGDLKAKIIGDSKWQTEALTNVIKNCIEHSFNDSKIQVSYEENKVYSMIKIRDFGEGIDSKDLKHIFERFYRGKRANSESVGIGLALAKAIIEEDNGQIKVSSSTEGTIFIIKYFKL